MSEASNESSRLAFAKAWAHAEICRASLVALAAELAPAGVDLLAIKGVYLAFAIAGDASFRPMADADAIVVRGTMGQALKCLAASRRWRVDGANYSAKTLIDTTLGGCIDLHRLALPPRFGHVRLASLRARARSLPEALGEHLLVPDVFDGAAISIANYVKDSVGTVGHGQLGRDLELLVVRGGLTPGPLASRLEEHGLRRIGIVAFTALAFSDQRWAEWLDACGPSAVERRAAELVVSAMRRLGTKNAKLSFLIARSIADSLGNAVLGGSLAFVRLARDAVFRRA